MTGGARRAAARRRIHNAAVGRIRIGVAIMAGGAFGALVVLWGGLGPSTTDGGRTPSANERPCGEPEGCESTTSPPPPTAPGGPGATVSSTPTAPPTGIPPRMRRPAATEPADGAGTDGRSPGPTSTSDPDGPDELADPSASPTGSAGPAPTSTSDGPVDVIVDLPPIILPTCILAC